MTTICFICNIQKINESLTDLMQLNAQTQWKNFYHARDILLLRTHCVAHALNVIIAKQGVLLLVKQLGVYSSLKRSTNCRCPYRVIMCPDHSALDVSDLFQE